MNRVTLIEKELTGSIIETFFEVYNDLGHGYLEQIYMTAMERALLARGHRVLREVSVRVSFRGQFVGLQRLDMLVDGKVLVEAKSTDVMRTTCALHFPRDHKKITGPREESRTTGSYPPFPA